jgi:hypothetical protein
MSLSQDLKTLVAWFQECLEGRAEFSAEGAREFSKELDRAAWNAAALEERAGSAVPDDGKPSTAENVIKFRRQPKRRFSNTDGDAA